MLEAKYRVEKIVSIMEDKKASDIKVYNVEGKTAFYDYMVMCTGSSTRNVLAILDAVKENIDMLKSVEGQKEAEWVLIDAADILVSIFTKDAREYYDLDGLYEEL
ncbi:ribosome silencing factor [Oceanivirga miroungae]|uniref:Ribosomal silencing factor RsfS n=1 Tax=Oceanivirga miroungae TaxID=1130046 RepID=A0A6I8MBP7_9FUSO|nr:ribosome silencing factor [Oceanivirga miroungae]VWL85622.1 iojap family protein [Oceanivirga miroungae]